MHTHTHPCTHTHARTHTTKIKVSLQAKNVSHDEFDAFAATMKKVKFDFAHDEDAAQLGTDDHRLALENGASGSGHARIDIRTDLPTEAWGA